MDISVPEGQPAPDALWRSAGLGSMLAGEFLVSALEDEEQPLFAAGSFDSDQIKGAGYVLRLAPDLWVQPDTPGSRKVVVCREGELLDRQPSIVLGPGDTALVSTAERFHLSYEMSALIGPAFSRAAQGLVLFHGMVAHPGYGRRAQPDEGASDHGGGETDPLGERLYLILANAGPRDIALPPGKAIAYVQFFRIAPTPAVPVANLGFDTLRNLFLGEGEPTEGSFSYFREAKDVAARLSDLDSAIESRLSALEERVEARVEAAETGAQQRSSEVDARVETIEKIAERTRSSAELVVLFGVFLVAATLFGVVTNLLIETVKTWPSDMDGVQTVAIIGICVVYALGVGILVGRIGWPAAKTHLPANSNKK